MKINGKTGINRLGWILLVAGALQAAESAWAAADPTLNVSLTRTNQSITVSWGGVAGVSYQVEASASLVDWTNISPVFSGGGSFSVSITDQNPGFFRVKRIFPAAPGSAAFDPLTGVLTVVGDEAHTVLTIAPDGFGNIVVNGGAIPITGGVPTPANTVLIQVLGSTVGDQITVTGLSVPAHLFGGDGNDTLVGGSGADLIVGGPGEDTVSGKQGNDVIYLGDGNDTVIWNPGDGSDLVEGEGGNDTIEFNGANVSENISLSANGQALVLFRDVANIMFTAVGVEVLNLHVLGGADTVTVNPLIGTVVGQVNIDLAAALGTTNGDGLADTVIVNGTAGADTFNVAASGSAVEVTGASLGSVVRVINAESVNDRVAFAGVGGDTVNVNGTAQADNLQILPSPVTGYARVVASGFTAPVDVIGALTLSVNGLAGNDTIVGANGLAALNIPIVLDGGDDDDTISGGDEADLIIGGQGNDVVSGGRGNDVVLLGDGDDTFTWNPGDGSDTVEGQTGKDTVVFNCANVSEHIDMSANGARFRLTRDVGNVFLDANGVETVNLHALGGADTITVNSLAGTAVAQVNIDLAAAGGMGDAQADTVAVNGTAGPDIFNVAVVGAAVEVASAGVLVHVTGAELAYDRIVFTGVGNDTVNVNGTTGPDTMQVLPSPVAGYVQTVVSGYAMPVDVIGALTLSVNGLAGNDTIVGANGLAALNIPIVLDGGDDDDTISGGDEADTIIGGPGNDVVSGGRGNDLVLLGDGNDTFTWNPGDGSDTVEGQVGNDTVMFNCANIGEHIDMSANGSRFRLTRDVGNVTLDADGVETINLPALGGADTITVNSLAGTAVTQVNIDLAATGGGGDAQADSVVINGTADPDTLDMTASGGAVSVTGLAAGILILHPEVAFDTLTVNGLGGTDSFSIGPGVTALIGVILNQ